MRKYKFSTSANFSIKSINNKVMPSVLTIVVIFMLLNVNRLIDENILIKAVTDEIIIDKSDLHGFVVDTRNLLIDKYIQEPKSQEQLNVWMKTRGILRQSSAETLNGKITRCGENSRLMINVFRNLGIKAKRLYFYGDIGTSHVLFEYFDEKENKWYVMNSFNDQVEFTFLNSVVDHNKVTKEDLFSHYDVKDTIYYEASNLNFQLKNVFGANTEIPYFLSYLMDEIFLLKIIILLFILLSLLAINFWIKKRIENE